MLTSDTMDTDACVKETLGLVEVGCEIVRITAPTVKDARNLENIRAALNAVGCHVPLVADIHFKPEAALEAARWVEKVRINPGNFADSKNSMFANTRTPNTPPRSVAFANASPRWLKFVNLGASPCESERTTAASATES